MYSEKIPNDGQRNCPKHVEFYSKNKFQKLVHLVGFIIRITSQLFIYCNTATCFGQFLCPSSGVFHCTHSNGMSYRFAECFRVVPSWSCSQAVSKPVWHVPFLSVKWKTPDDGQRNCPKNVEFYSKNKFEKLVHLVGFIKRITSQLFIYCDTATCFGPLQDRHQTVKQNLTLLLK